MDQLIQIVRQEVRKYASSGEGANARLFPVLDDEYKTYSVIAVDYPTRTHEASLVVVLARVVDDKVIIEEDTTDKPLVDALMQKGIPREKIILAYAGEATDAYPSRISLSEYD
jgi:hypothetical protein